MPPEDDAIETQDFESTKRFQDVPVVLTVSIGQVQTTIRDLIALKSDSVLVVGSSVEDPVTLIAGDRPIAKGELQLSSEDGEKLSIRITELCDPQ